MKQEDIKLRNGIPTKKSMELILNSFHKDFWAVNLCFYWSKKNVGKKYIWWSRLSVQKQMEHFIDFASDLGFVFGKYEKYTGDNGRNGSLQIVGFNYS